MKENKREMQTASGTCEVTQVNVFFVSTYALTSDRRSLTILFTFTAHKNTNKKCYVLFRNELARYTQRRMRDSRGGG